MKYRSVGAILLFLVLAIFMVASMGYVFSAQDQSAANTGGLNTASGYSVANEISAAWILQNHTYYAMTIVADKATGQVTLTAPLGVKGSVIYIQTDNSSQSAWKLLNQNDLYTYMQIGSSNLKGTITAAYMYFGSPVNDTGTTAVADKGITGYTVNTTMYSSSVNQLGKAVQIPADDMLFSLPSSTPQYMIQVNGTAANTSLAESFTVTQYWQYTAHYPLVTEIFLIALVFDGILGYLFYRALPEHYGPEEDRVVRWQSKKEARTTYEGIALLGITLIFLGYAGEFTPIFGWASAIAFLSGFALFVNLLTADTHSHTYGRAILVGFLGGAALVVVQLFVAFGSAEYDALISGYFVAALQAFVYIGIMLVVSYFGILNTKRVHLRERGSAE